MKTQHFKMVFLGKPWPFPWLFHIQGEPSQVSVPIGLVVEAASKFREWEHGMVWLLAGLLSG